MTTARCWSRRWIDALELPVLLSHPLASLAAQSEAGAAPDMAAGIPTTTPIKHLVSIMQSNHSFDSLFGTYPGAEGIPAGTCMPTDPAVVGGDCVQPFALANNGADLDHTHTTFQRQYRDGKNDGFISVPSAW